MITFARSPAFLRNAFPLRRKTKTPDPMQTSLKKYLIRTHYGLGEYTNKGKYETIRDVYNTLRRMRTPRIVTVTHNKEPLHAQDRQELARLINTYGCPFSN